MRWIASARFDLGLILGPPIAAVLLVLAVPALRRPDLAVWGWVLFVILIDVAHVYASLYRTYFDREERRRRATLYAAVPIACFAAGVACYSVDALLFWRVLAYVAVFHFVRQQYGFVMLYRHRARERGVWDARIDKIAVYATMLYPLAFWHSEPGREFAWFVPGDFVALPRWVASAVLWLYAAALALFIARQLQIAAMRRPLNWGKIGIVASTAATWYVGIVLLNSDFAFTITNVVAHGVPYFALVWLYGRRKWQDRSWLGLVHRPAAVGLFLGLLCTFAWLEEGLWDGLVWREHGAVFGGLTAGIELPGAALALLVPLLALPQATHYVLDAWIWKFDGSNPGLRYYLFLEGEPPHASQVASPTSPVECVGAPRDL